VDFFSNNKIIVIKIGSSTLTAKGKINKPWFKSFVKDVVRLKKQGKQVIIVTSGAIALGRKYLNINQNSEVSLKEKQALASIGQVDLILAYKEFFSKHKIIASQILLSLDDTEDKKRFLNTKNTISVLLQRNIIPIINENDTVATEEIQYGDNDRLSAKIAGMVGADLLILLSDIAGLYDSDPKTNPNAKFIKTIDKIDGKIKAMAGGKGSSIASGGMKTKIEAAIIANESSCKTIICFGKRKAPLSQLNKKDALYSAFIPPKDK